MMRSAPVLIAGGGIGGLAAALALARRGIPACVLERRKEFSEAGAGIQIGPNGVHALRRLGADAALAASVGRPDAIVVHDGHSGRKLARLPLGDWIEARHGAPYWVAHRRDLQAALLARVGQEPLIEVRTGFEASQFSASGTTVTLHSSSGDAMHGAALIAADGLHSSLRAQLVDSPQLRFSGKTATRTVLDSAAVANLLDTRATGVWLAPEAHVVHYPVRAGREVAMVVIIADDWQAEDWAAPADAGELLRRLDRFAPPLQQALRRADDWRRWSLYDAEPLASWTRGRVTLLGDAAHPVLPFLAQGGSMALEDAVTLADCLAEGADDIERALERYERKRLLRTARTSRASRRNGQIFHLSGVAAAVRNAMLRSLPGRRVMAGYDWLYGWGCEG
ncbi:MAG TPA: FAD-dependent monooxygenase [Hyphomicrobiaceae bacterium]|nr:FAD-dependent monooxygenase [Hyphomicrobiaceae bacterium]